METKQLEQEFQVFLNCANCNSHFVKYVKVGFLCNSTLYGTYITNENYSIPKEFIICPKCKTQSKVYRSS